MTEPSTGGPASVPVILVLHGGGHAAVLARARALRNRHTAIVHAFEGPVDVEALASSMALVTATQQVPVVHLVGDLDVAPSAEEGATAPEVVHADRVVGQAQQARAALRERYPLIDVGSWLVARTGSRVSAAEIDLVDRFTTASDLEPRGALVVTGSSGEALDHTAQDVDSQVADLVHLLALPGVDAALSGGPLAAGVGTVVFRPKLTVAAGVRSIDDVLDGLVEMPLRDPGYDDGKRWIRDLALGPPEVGDDAENAEEDLLSTGPGGTSLPADPGEAVRELEAQLDSVDPGLWPGHVAAVVDVASAPRTDPNAVRSPLVVAYDSVDANIEARRAALRKGLEAEARDQLRRRRNLPSTAAWCEGVRAGLVGGAAELTNQSTEDDDEDLAAAYQRLDKATRFLPYTSSTLVRGLLIIVMMLVVGYAFSPVANLLAWALSRRLVWLGETLAENARIWARITAIGVGCLLWVWWEAKWRRARRLRRRYIDAADQQLRELVARRVVVGRLRILEDLIALIGTGRHEHESLRAWLAAGVESVGGIRADASADGADGGTLEPGRWSVTLPDPTDAGRAVDELDHPVRDQLRDTPLDVIAAAELGVPADTLASEIGGQLEQHLENAGVAGAARWKQEDEVPETAREILRAKLYAGLPAALAERHESVRTQSLVIPDDLTGIVGIVAGSNARVVRSSDPDMVANLWTTNLVLRDSDGTGRSDGSATPDTGGEGDPAAADLDGDAEGGDRRGEEEAP